VNYYEEDFRVLRELFAMKLVLALYCEGHVYVFCSATQTIYMKRELSKRDTVCIQFGDTSFVLYN
jgi:hypothetical protein